MIEQIPSVELVNGSLSVDVEQPYTIADPDSGKPLLLIDTTGQHTSLNGIEAKALLTRTKLIARNDTGRVQTFDLSEIGDFKLDASIIQQWTGTFVKFIEVTAFTAGLVSTWIYRFFQVILLAIIGVVLIKPSGSIKFAALMRLAAVALTPTIAICTLAKLCSVPTQVWHWWPFCLGLMLTYFYFSISSRQEPEACLAEA